MADDLSLEQQKALAIADAKRRLAQQRGGRSDTSPALERFGSGLKDPLQGGAQLVAHLMPPGMEAAITQANNWLARNTGLVGPLPAGGIDEQTRAREQAIARGEPEGTDWWRMAGNVASPANLALAPLGPIAGGAAAGALTPVADDDYWRAKELQIGEGAAAGGLTGAASRVLGRAAGSTDPAKRMLQDAGVTLTPGQQFGRVGKHLEEVAKTTPVTGEAIREGEQRALDSFNVATVNEALRPIATRVKATTAREAIQQGQAALDRAYDGVLTKIPSVSVDKNLLVDLQKISTMVSELPRDAREQFSSILKNRVRDRLAPSWTADGRTLKLVDEDLRKASQSMRSGDGTQRQLGQALDSLREAIRATIARQYPPAAADLGRVNMAYSMMADIERAAQTSSISESRFTPGALLAAKRASDASPRNRQFAAGRRPMQDWADAGQQVMGNKLPSSGTGERVSYFNPIAWGGSALTAPFLGLYSQGGLDAMRAWSQLAPETRAALSQALQQGGRAAAPGAGAAVAGQ